MVFSRHIHARALAALTALLVLPTSVTATTGDFCCSRLSGALGAKVVYPSSNAYNASLSSYWAQQQQSIVPSCIIQPTSAQDVSVALGVIVPNSCNFAVRGGGHGSVTGVANIAAGVTIDLRGLNSIEPLDNYSVLAVGSGQTWGAVYSFLDGHGVSIAGARDSGIGVGGSTLGGGLGFFAPKVGFACDSVIQFEVVLANGSVVKASRDSNTDLWKALKGGGSNLGIVTKFWFSTFPIGEIWAGDVSFPPSALSSQVQAFYNYVSNPNFDINSSILLNFHYEAGTEPVIVNEFTFSAPVVKPSAFKEFYAISGQLGNNTGVMTIPEFSSSLEDTSPFGFQQITWATSFRNSMPILYDIWTLYNESLSIITGIEGISWSLTLEPLTQTVATQAEVNGGNILGVKPPAEGLIIMLLSASFTPPSSYTMVSNVADQLLERIISAAKMRGVYEPFVDMNHAKSGQNPLISHGLANYMILRRAARNYDPHGVFQTLMPGGFKLKIN